MGVLEDSYFPCVEQPYDDLENKNLDIYELRQCYNENERIFAKAVILINNKLVRLIDITLEQWLDLKFRNHKKVDKEIKKGEVTTWLIQNYKKQFEEYIEIKRRLEVDEVNIDVEFDPTNVEIETDIFLFETPLCKEFKEFNHLLQIDVNVLTRDLPGFKTYDDLKIHGTMNGITKCHGLMKNHGWNMGFERNLLMIYVMNASRLVSKVDMLNGPLVTGEKMDIVTGNDSGRQHGLFSRL
ncbi:hypothetical protein Tco_0027569 [Tanacetum coccineum]